MSDVVLATVLFTDIVGSSERVAELGDARWAELLERHNGAVRAELKRFGGRELDSAGDGFLASFDAPGQAVRSGMAVVEAVRELGVSVRIGIHTGECERIGEKLGGVAVHIGARICATAGPGEVLVSSTVRDLLAGSGFVLGDRGLRALKGIPGEWRVYAVELPRQDVAASARIQLCGRVVVEFDGRRIENELPGRQGKVLFTYLVANRRRPVGRDELIEALWPNRTPNGVDSSLSALLSKLRRALGPERLDGRSNLQLQLPEHTWVDLEAALEAMHRAESAVMRENWPEAWAAARVPLHIACRPFLPGEDAPWIDDLRGQLADLYTHSLEATAQASLNLGGTELDTAERSARSLVKEAPYRESGYRLLMETLARRDNVAEPLQVYESLRKRLREELGAPPSKATQEFHRRLLG